jgi:alkanesulfonate monooxygenase SsuD/methylene tetrahydromethanopterin reductase-like flavin-dependent oxidoreductase (luciferase family)
VALGSFIGAGRSLDAAIRRAQRAEELGYESVYLTHIGGRDSVTLLTIYAANTERVRLGTGVIPIYARTPANMAQSFATLDEFSGGRAVADLGISHKPVVEGWYGQSIDKPLRECASTWRSCGRSSAATTRRPASPPACCASRVRSPTA